MTRNDAAASYKDGVAARASEALALRCLSRYRAARDGVVDRVKLPDTPSYQGLEARYLELMAQVTSELPRSAAAEVALIELIESILADAISPHEGPLADADADLCDALRMLHLVQRQANERDVEEAVQAERLRFGLTPAGGAAWVRPTPPQTRSPPRSYAKGKRRHGSSVIHGIGCLPSG